jgi:hypothetical protein
MRCADCGQFWYSSGARRMLRDDDRCPTCEGKLELVDIGDAESERGASGDPAEGGTRNG